MKDIKQIRVKKTEPNGDSRIMHVDEKTWKAIVDSKGAYGQYELAPADPINSKPVELIASKTDTNEASVIVDISPSVNENSDLAYYRELAKEAKIKGYQVMGIDTLKQKLNIK